MFLYMEQKTQDSDVNGNVCSPKVNCSSFRNDDIYTNDIVLRS